MAKKTTKKSTTADTASARSGRFISKTTDKRGQRASKNGSGDTAARELTTKDLTLRAFRMTYESHHRRKAS